MKDKTPVFTTVGADRYKHNQNGRIYVASKTTIHKEVDNRSILIPEDTRMARKLRAFIKNCQTVKSNG